MFAWTTRGPEVFKCLSPDLFEPTDTLAATQGLYNGFLAAGLIWSLFIGATAWQPNVALYFLIVVLVVAVYGAVTAERRIVFVQGLPALTSIVAILL